MNEDCLKLTTYFGERHRAGDRFLADALMDVYGRLGLRASVLLRGTEGFGFEHHLRTERLLTLSEDLPVVSVAVDTRERVQRALDEVVAVSGDGLISLERARLLTGEIGEVVLPEGPDEATKLTVSLGRQERIARRPAYLEVVELLRRHGVAGATVFLGVDGTRHGVRQRARFFGTNAEVPMAIVSVGAGESIAGALPELGRSLAEPLLMLERVRLCKRDGRRLAEPRHLPEADPSGLAIWQNLMVYSREQAMHEGRPLHVELIRRLRLAGAAGATAIRGIWGYHGAEAPHGDSPWSIRRRVPVLTFLVDTPARMRRWWPIVDEVTEYSGLVTSEMVSAVRATGGGVQRGGLALAQP